MRTRSAYHIDYSTPNLGGFEVKIWVGNILGTPTYEQVIQAIDERVTVDIAELVNSLLPKTGTGSIKVRYKVDAFDNELPAVFFKTWQKEYDAFFGYRLFEDGAQFDSELLPLDQFASFDLTTGTTISSNTIVNPWLEETATEFEGVSFIEFKTFAVPFNGKYNFSMFYYFDEGTYTIRVKFSNNSFAQFDLTVSNITGNFIEADDIVNCDVKATMVGTSINDQQYTFIQVEGGDEVASPLEVRIEATRARLYAPSAQRFFDPQGRDQAVLQTNKSLFWKKGEPTKFAYLINSTFNLSPSAVTWFYTDGTNESTDAFTRDLIPVQPNTKEVERIEINIQGEDNIVIPVSYIPCTKYQIRKIDFINKFGIRQSIFFYGSSRVSNQNQNESYKSNILVGGAYDVTAHQIKNYNANGKQTEIINTGYYAESFNPVFEELFLSERIWIDDKPATIVSNNFEELTKLNNDLINYEITFEYANDLISNVR
jgi:hypothetical protein